MSILIRGMEMPTSCLDCPLTDGHSASCLITKQSVYFFVNKRHNDCPLVPVSPHGRLIDADVLAQAVNDFPYGYRGMILAEITVAPTIIPASEEET